MVLRGRAVVLALALLVVPPVAAQTPTADLLRLAGAAIDAKRLDSAGVLLRAALAAATDTAERVEALVWTAVWEFLNGRDSLARQNVRAALRLNSTIGLGVADDLLPLRVVAMFNEERQKLDLLGSAVLTSNMVEVQPVRLSGPAVQYPAGAWRRRSAGRAIVEGIVDTSGRFEPASLELVDVPDSELAAPVRAAMLAARFSPGRFRGKAVRTIIRLGIVLNPGPPPNPATLVTEARAQLASGHADSALGLVDFALDPALQATPAIRTYAQLARGVALRKMGRDSAGTASLDSGLAGYAALRASGVDLAPTFRHFADSVRAGRRPAPPTGPSAGAPTALESVDRPPALVSFPPIDYPPEMLALRVGGTVVVELAVDSAGRPLAGTAKVVQTPNAALNAAALRIVAGALYRPAVRAGKPVRVTIRQPVTFSP